MSDIADVQYVAYLWWQTQSQKYVFILPWKVILHYPISHKQIIIMMKKNRMTYKKIYPVDNKQYIVNIYMVRRKKVFLIYDSVMP